MRFFALVVAVFAAYVGLVCASPEIQIQPADVKMVPDTHGKYSYRLSLHDNNVCDGSHNDGVFSDRKHPVAHLEYKIKKCPKFMSCKIDQLLQDTICKVSTTPLNDDVTAVHLMKDENTLIVGAGTQGIVFLNVSDAQQPHVRSQFNTDGDAFNFAISVDEKHLYVADGGNGLVILDIEDIDDVQELGRLNTAGDGTDVAVFLSNNQKVAYVVDGDEIGIIDVTDPTSFDYCGVEKILEDTQTKFAVVGAEQEWLYVCNGADGLMIYNIKNNPCDPQLKGTFDTDGSAVNVAVNEEREVAFVSDSHNGLVILDISDRTNPEQISRFTAPCEVTDSWLSTRPGDPLELVFVACNDGGVFVVDINRLSNPEIIAQFDTTETANELVVSSDEQMIFVAGLDGGVVALGWSEQASYAVFNGYTISHFNYTEAFRVEIEASDVTEDEPTPVVASFDFLRKPECLDCKNGGVCQIENGTQAFYCNCTGTDKVGLTCGSNFDYCSSDPCQNNGTCSNRDDGSETFACACEGPWNGTDCGESTLIVGGGGSDDALVIALSVMAGVIVLLVSIMVIVRVRHTRKKRRRKATLAGGAADSAQMSDISSAAAL